MMRSIALMLGSSILTLVLVVLWSGRHPREAVAVHPPMAAMAPSVTDALPTPTAPPPVSVSLTVTGEPLLVALDRLATLIHAGLIIHHNAQQLVHEEADINLKEQPWKAVEKELMRHGVEARVDDGILHVRAWGTEGRSRIQRVIYSVATMTTLIPPKAGPRLGVQRLSDSRIRTEPLFFGGQNENIEFIEEVQPAIGPESWENEGVSIEYYRGSIVVNQSPEVHGAIARFLTAREEQFARQAMVRIYRLAKPPTTSDHILDASAWNALAKGLIPDVVLTVIDGKLNHHFSGVRRAYTAADIFQNGLGSPVMGMSTNGLVIEVEPHITVEGISTRIRLQATVSDTMITSPVKDAAGRLLFDIDLPDQRIDHADDVRLIPPGGAALYRFDDRTYAVSVEPVIP